MIKKSRKILTLLLAVLLIMSSMSALSVSAADVSFTMSGQDRVVTNAEGGSLEVSYTIDGSTVEESGWYNLRVRSDGATSNTNTSKYYKLTAAIGDDSWTTVAKINRADTYAEPGRFYLTAGQGFTVTLTYDFSNETSATTTETVNNLNFTKVDPEIAVSSTQETKIHALDYLNRGFANRLDAVSTSTTITAGEEVGWAGYAMVAKNNYGIYSIDVPRKTEYEVYALTGSKGANTLALYVDDFDTAFSSTSIAATGSANSAYRTGAYTKLGTTILDAGPHDLKLNFTGSNTVYFYGFKLVPVARNTISSTGTSTIPVKSYLYYETTASNGNLNTSYYSDATGVYTGKHDYIAFRQSATQKDKLYYTVSSEKAQIYTMSIIASRSLNQTFKVTNIDTGDTLQVAVNIKELSTGNKNTVRYTMGDIELPQGVSTLMVESISGSSIFVYAFELTPPLATISAEINAEYNQGEGYQTVSVPVKFAGSAVMSGLEVAVAYDEAVELTGCTAGTTGAILTLPNVEEKPNPAVIIHLDEGGVGTQLNEGTLATLEFKVPLSTVKNYEFTIAITEAKGENAVDVKDSIKTKNGVVKVISTDPIFTFTKDGAEVESVENGAMTLNVNLNGNNDKNLVIFAIYSTTSEGYSVLEYSDTATPENGTATITLNVTKVDGVNYYAKAFVWDTTTYYGFTQTLGN